MSKIVNEAGIEIYNRHPKERKEKAQLLFSRNCGGQHDGKFELKLDFEHGSVTVYLDPQNLANMLSHATESVDAFVHGTVDSRRKPKQLVLDIAAIPKKFFTGVAYADRDDITKQPRLQQYVLAAMKAAGIRKSVVTFRRSNQPHDDKIFVQEID